MGSANIRETAIALSYRKQAALQTKAGAGNYWRIANNSQSLASVTLATENDATDMGKGHEFATQQFLLNWDGRIPFEKYATSEGLAFLFAFGLGSVTETTPATGAHQYVCTPLDPVAGGIELPSFTYVEAIRQGVNAVFDQAIVGAVVNSFGLSITSGVGRQNCRATAEFIGCGKIEDPSGITIPSITTEHSLNAGSAGITIIGNDYVSLKKIVSLETTWTNAIRVDQGFYPGSGTVDGAAIRGRMENGDRVCTLKFIARMDKDSNEFTLLKNQTTGTAVITLQGALIDGSTYNSANLTYHKVGIATRERGNDNGIVTVECECTPFYDESDGIVTFTATTQTTGICAAEI